MLKTFSTFKQLLFRVTPSNRFTIPVLLNTLEKGNWDQLYTIHSIDQFQHFIRFTSKKNLIIAYSFMTSHLPDVYREIRKLRRTFQDNALFIAGGPHPTGDPEGTLKMGFDSAVCGDGENGFPELLIALQNNENIRGRIFHASPLADLDESFPVSRHDSLVPPIEITRGCFYGCAFCQTRGRRPMHRSFESIERFFNKLIQNNYIFRTGFICPSGFEYACENPGKRSPDKLESILAAAKSRGIRYLEYAIFPSEVRPNTVSIEFLQVIKKYCSNKKITIGAQTASERMLRKQKRGHSPEDIEQAAALIYEQGLRPQLDFIMGFPDETEEDQMRTLEHMKKLSLRYKAWNQVHYFIPLSGTPQYKRMPAPLTKITVRLLDEYSRNGYANNWWKQGFKTAQKLAKTLETLNQI